MDFTAIMVSNREFTAAALEALAKTVHPGPSVFFKGKDSMRLMLIGLKSLGIWRSPGGVLRF